MTHNITFSFVATIKYTTYSLNSCDNRQTNPTSHNAAATASDSRRRTSVGGDERITFPELVKSYTK